MSSCEGDCNDLEDGESPDNEESCDGLDNDCDGSVDEGTLSDWWYDGDGDGDGPMSLLPHLVACAPPSGFVESNTDCDDLNADVYAGAPGAVRRRGQRLRRQRSDRGGGRRPRWAGGVRRRLR